MIKSLTTVALVLALAGASATGQPAALDESALSEHVGLILPSRRVELNAPMTGILAEVLVEEGQPVEADQPLAQMDDRLQKLVAASAELRAASEAQIERAAASLAEMEILLEQAKIVLARDAASEWEVRRAQLQRDQAKAEHQAALEGKALAESELALERQKLEQHRMIAPFAGVVTRITAEPGGTVSQSDAILTLAALDPLEAELYLPVDYYGELKVGERYALRAAAPVHADLTGQLVVVDPVIEAASQTFRTVFRIENDDLRLPAGVDVRLLSLTPTAPMAAQE